MSPHAHIRWNEDFDEPWRRLPWIVLAALLTWVALLGGFAHLLKQQAPPEPQPTAIEARIVEMPQPTAGLQGGGRPAGAPVPAPAIAARAPAPVPKPVPKAKPKPVHHVRKAVVKPPPAITEPPSPFGTVKHVEEHAPLAPSVASKGPAGGAVARHPGSATEEGEGGVGGGGSGSGAGLGSDNAGARAMYAPKPTIPDDLREGAFSTMAVARFKVSSDGAVEVSLIKPTPNPRLNQILLDTLKQWKFFPAMKAGVAINSEFEVRIPIAVQ
jgi:protein TonB